MAGSKSATLTTSRRAVVVAATFTTVAAVVAAMMVAILVTTPVLFGASALFGAPAQPTPRTVHWVLAQGGPGQTQVMPAHHWRLDPSTSQTATIIPVGVYWPARLWPKDASWLAAPEITYAEDAVTITLHQHPDFDQCEPGVTPCIVSQTLEPVYFEIHLTEPLRGRALFDGATDPPTARPYP